MKFQGTPDLLDILKGPVLSIQEFFQLTGRTLKNLPKRPHYPRDILNQMDILGVGSLPIVLLVGFFSGVVMALQMSRALRTYGAVSQTGPIVAITLVREMGPVLTSIVVAGRNAAGIASELGSMKVTEQIDAMRALGTDPVQKLVKPRLIATAIMLPCLTAIADFVGLLGGYLIAYGVLKLTTSEYWNGAYRAIEYNDIAQGLIKPFIYAMVISMVGCFCGLRTTGGTQGVGLATTQAVVVSSVWIFVLNAFITQIFVTL
ncbi:MAG: ABC transporter permease [Candidatus Solibacter usitatus]|nr:ABC transporter permease [Candidatus Solibacter usitatus]